MSWIKKVHARLPCLRVNQFEWVNGNVLILDTLEQDAFDILSQLSFLVPMTYYRASEFSVDLSEIVPFHVFDQILLPGAGALRAGQAINSKKTTHISARRVGYKNPVPRIESFLINGTSYLILDDVIATGQTVCGVIQKGSLSNVSAACWVMQYPRDARLAVCRNVYACRLVRGRNGKVPINSLSTLMHNARIRESYASRFCRNPEEFSLALQLLTERSYA